MENINFIWYESATIWAAIISGIFMLINGIATIILYRRKNNITHKLTKELESYKSELDIKNKQIQKELDIQLEKSRIQYSQIQTKRLEIFYEVCSRIITILNQINSLAAYNDHECKNKIDFNYKCEDAICDPDCILNYKTKISDFSKYCLETNNFMEKNEMYFSLDTVNLHLKFINQTFTLVATVTEVIRNSNKQENERAAECFKILSEFDTTLIQDIRSNLIDQYRHIIGTPRLTSME